MARERQLNAECLIHDLSEGFGLEIKSFRLLLGFFDFLRVAGLEKNI